MRGIYTKLALPFMLVGFSDFFVQDYLWFITVISTLLLERVLYNTVSMLLDDIATQFYWVIPLFINKGS
ncbi:hypothetical protein AWJ07_14330 [Shewanella frigidimarina]|uniref:Uncharacterized protein n=1 Tax=Shewanella frigidimarina TaxID=56812 RepID=A0A106C1H0_SHEFR|nr:hypothetical protein AWJ07_14330 [Shewanella frigidimarina]